MLKKTVILDCNLATHSGKKKLLSLWPHLPVERKNEILHELENGCAYNELLSLILETDCEAIRYLAVKKVILSDDDAEEKEILKKIEADQSDLVRYAQDEASFGIFLDKPEKFFSYPKAKQLAIVRGSSSPNGKNFSELIVFALASANVEKEHIADLLIEYIHNDNLKKHLTIWDPYDGYGLYATHRDLEALWGLCIKLPEELGIILVRNLPATVFDASFTQHQELIPADVLGHLAKSYLLQWLLEREDVGLSDYRKKVLFDDQFSESQKETAAFYNLCLNYDEFEKILESEGKFLRFIKFSGSLELAFIKAAKDYSKILERDEWEDFQRQIDSRRKCLKKEELKREERELRIYEVAKELVPWKKEKPDEEALQSLENLFAQNGLDIKIPLKNCIVPGNTWKTFINLKNLIDGSYENRKLFERTHLGPEFHAIRDNDGDENLISTSLKNSAQIKSSSRERVYLWIILGVIIGYFLRGCV